MVGSGHFLRTLINVTTLEGPLQREGAGFCHGEEREVWRDRKEDKPLRNQAWRLSSSCNNLLLLP